MKDKVSKYLESRRVSVPGLRSDASLGFNGIFEVIDGKGTLFRVICSDQMGWEHVSVTVRSGPKRTPTWAEMDWIKGLFWKDSETVMQLHVPREQWVNNSQFCLHLWRPVAAEIPLPPPAMVGYKELGVIG